MMKYENALIDDVTENNGMKENGSSTYCLHDIEDPEVKRKAKTQMNTRHRINQVNKEKKSDESPATNMNNNIEDIATTSYDCKRGRQFNVWFRMLCRRVPT